MTKRWNIINNIINLLLTLVSLFYVTFLALERYNEKMFIIVLYFFLFGLFSAFVYTFIHELGHLIGGKANAFDCLSFQVLFLRWEKQKNRFVFTLSMLGFSAGSTELVAKNTVNIEKRYKKVILSGIIFSICIIPICLIPIFIKTLPLWLFSLLIMFLPIGVYSVLDNGLPMISEGVKNDGALLKGLSNGDDSSKVMINLLKIQSELYNGKTPAEIDKDLYFDLPQLREDDVNFFLLLNARYNYYLDNKDIENAKDTIARLLSLEDYAQKSHMLIAKVDALYSACTFNYNEEVADDLTYELEKFINNVNTPANLRAKLAYIQNVRKETEALEYFYKKAIKEAKKCPISGLSKFEQKLINELYSK